MSRKHQQSSIEQIVRRQGSPRLPKVDVIVPEVRSCLVAPYPPPLPGETRDLLGAIVVIWEFTLSLGDVQEFHDFLRKHEPYIAASTAALVEGGAAYRGTYMQYGPGDPSYRTIWTYASLEAMAQAWRTGLHKKSSNFYKALMQLREFWLRDPNRREARWVPARFFFDPDQDLGDEFAKLTLEAVKHRDRRKR